MNLKIIVRTVGVILIFTGISMGLCVALSEYLFEPSDVDFRAMLSSAGMSVLVGVSMYVICWTAKVADILRRESIAIVILAWLFVVLFGSLPFVLGSSELTLVQAVFESMSGFTTTGATVLPEIEAVGKSILLWRSMTQWIGGMGFLVLFVAIINLSGQGSLSLFKNESSAQHDKSFYSSVRKTAITLWYVYIFYTVTCGLGLYFLGMTAYDAINHAFTTMATGGFSTKNQSIESFPQINIHIWLTLFMVLASLNFLQTASAFRWGSKKMLFDKATLWFLALYFASSLIIFFINARSHYFKDISTELVDSLFQTASIISTTGFNTVDFDGWATGVKVLLLGLMVIGGCAGSTAGGIKINRVLAVLQIFREQVIRFFRPNVVIGLDKRLSGEQRIRWRIDILFLFFLAAFCIFISTFVISLIDTEISFFGIFSAVIACLFNIGPGFAEVGPTHNFAIFSPTSQLILATIMLIGRLEFMTAMVIIMPSFWKKY